MLETAKDMLPGCVWKLFITARAYVLVFPLYFLMVFLYVEYVINRRASFWVVIIAFGILSLLLIAGSFAFTAFSTRKRIRHLDAAFVPLGLDGKSYRIYS